MALFPPGNDRGDQTSSHSDQAGGYFGQNSHAIMALVSEVAKYARVLIPKVKSQKIEIDHLYKLKKKYEKEKQNNAIKNLAKNTINLNVNQNENEEYNNLEKKMIETKNKHTTKRKSLNILYNDNRILTDQETAEKNKKIQIIVEDLKALEKELLDLEKEYNDLLYKQNDLKISSKQSSSSLSLSSAPALNDEKFNAIKKNLAKNTINVNQNENEEDNNLAPNHRRIKLLSSILNKWKNNTNLSIKEKKKFDKNLDEKLENANSEVSKIELNKENLQKIKSIILTIKEILDNKVLFNDLKQYIQLLYNNIDKNINILNSLQGQYTSLIHKIRVSKDELNGFEALEDIRDMVEKKESESKESIQDYINDFKRANILLDLNLKTVLDEYNNLNSHVSQKAAEQLDPLKDDLKQLEQLINDLNDDLKQLFINQRPDNDLSTPSQTASIGTGSSPSSPSSSPSPSSKVAVLSRSSSSPLPDTGSQSPPPPPISGSSPPPRYGPAPNIVSESSPSSPSSPPKVAVLSQSSPLHMTGSQSPPSSPLPSPKVVSSQSSSSSPAERNLLDNIEWKNTTADLLENKKKDYLDMMDYLVKIQHDEKIVEILKMIYELLNSNNAIEIKNLDEQILKLNSYKIPSDIDSSNKAITDRIEDINKRVKRNKNSLDRIRKRADTMIEKANDDDNDDTSKILSMLYIKQKIEQDLQNLEKYIYHPSSTFNDKKEIIEKLILDLEDSMNKSKETQVKSFDDAKKKYMDMKQKYLNLKRRQQLNSTNA